MINARLYKNGNKTLAVLIDQNRPEDLKVWYSIEVNEKQIESGFMSIEQYLKITEDEDWTLKPNTYGLMI